MKTLIKLLFAFLFLLVFKPGHAQVYKDSLKTQFLRYCDLLVQKKFIESTKYVNPGFFKIVSKEQLAQLMERVYNSPEIDFSLENPSVVSIEDSKQISNNHYARLQYTNVMKMRFKPVDGKLPDSAATRSALVKQFGQENVSYDAASEIYKIIVLKKVVANSADKKKWTFVVVEDRQKPVLEKFIPKEML